MDTSTKKFNLELIQWMGIHWKSSMWRLRAIRKLLAHIILMASKIIQASLKRNKNHVMGMFVCMNAVNTYFIQYMNSRVQHKIQPSVIW